MAAHTSLQSRVFRVAAACAFAALAGGPAAAQEMRSGSLPVIDRAAGDFTIIAVPDTQRYARYYPEILRSQFKWIVDSQQRLDIRFVAHVGDLVDEDEPAEWAVIDEVFSLLDDRVPYLAVPGNHDYDRAEAARRMRGSSRFNAVFSPYRFLGKPWYGGHRGVTSNNSFAYFQAGGKSFMVLGLEFGPSDQTLAWADDILDSHDSVPHHAILVTHAYMYNDNTRLGEGDDHSPHKIDPAWNDGEQIWEKLVRRHDNVFMVLSGHVTHDNDGTGRLISKTDDASPVLQMLGNYQFMEHGGKGFLRILVFRPSQDRLDVYTYSPWFDRFLTGEDQQFSEPLGIFAR